MVPDCVILLQHISSGFIKSNEMIFLLKYPIFKKYLIWDKKRRAAELINQPEIETIRMSSSRSLVLVHDWIQLPKFRVFVHGQIGASVSCWERKVPEAAATQSCCHRFSARQLRRGATSPSPSTSSPPIRNTGNLWVSSKVLTSLSVTSQCMKRSNLRRKLRERFRLLT